LKTIIFLIAVLVCTGGHAQVFKCKAANGRIIYSDVACPINSAGSSVNLSGANITDDQKQAAQVRTADNKDTENCQRLNDLAQQTFNSFVGNTNAKRWATSFQSLQNLVNTCASRDVCGTIKSRVDRAQERFNEDNNAARGGQLNSVMALYASSCNGNGNAKQTVSP